MAEVGINTVKRFEQSAEMVGSVRTLWKIQTALEQAGIEFIPGDESKGTRGTPETGGQRQRRPTNQTLSGPDGREGLISGRGGASWPVASGS